MIAFGLVLGVATETAAARNRGKRSQREQPTSAAPASAPVTVSTAPPVDPIERARTRENLLRGRAEMMEERARAHALATYRLARRREAEVLANGKRAAETARALEAALVVLRRSAWETAALRKEVVHATRERAALEKALVRRPDTTADSRAEQVAVVGEGIGTLPVPARASGADPRPDPAAAAPVAAPALGPLALPWPARGTVVSGPGQRRDPATGTESIAGGVEILSRMNEPAIAIAAGKVRVVQALPQGGHAVVIAHPEGRTSITTGLRVVSVSVGDEVTANQNIGFVGRDLDGAPVITFELWQAGVPIDPRPYLASE
ncbi:MAG TPA: M23 family metallopeptidase [Polyangia bacterium]